MPKTTIALLPCTSSQIRAFGYDPKRNVLAIRFTGKSGEKAVYEYANVPLSHFEGLSATAADPEGSVGRYFGEHIKNKADLYPFTKLVDEDENATAGAGA